MRLLRFWRKMFGKLVLVVALACVPAIIMAFWLNIISINENKSLTLNSIRHTCENKYKIIEDRLLMLRTSLGELVNHPSLMYLTMDSTYNPDMASNMKSLQNSLSVICDGNPFAADIEIYLPQINYVVSEKSGVYGLDQDRYNAILNELKTGSASIRNIDGQPVFALAYPYYDSKLSDQIVILSKLSTEEIQSRMNSAETAGLYTDYLLLGDFMIPDGKTFPDKEKATAEFHHDSLDISYRYFADLSDIRMDTSGYILVLLIVIVLIIVTMVASSLILNRVIARPIRKLISAFGRLELGDLEFELDNNTGTAEYDSLFDSFNRTIKTLNQLMNDAYEDGKRLKTAEYKQLAYQIRPHFLYNCLHIINCMASEGDIAGIKNMTGHLTAYCKSLTGVMKVSATLLEEYNLIQSYISIQTIRFDDRISAEVALLPEELQKQKIPHLSLQPIIENVYTHGLKNKQENGRFKVSFEHHEQDFTVTVEDNGEELGDELLASLTEALKNPVDDQNLALINVDRRIKLMSGNAYGLTLKRSDMGGLKAVLTFEIKHELD